MKTISLRTEPEIYDKLKLICTINRDNVYHIITELMRKYVIENENVLNSIRSKPTPEIPEFFGEQSKWFRYIHDLNYDTYGDTANRINFVKFLLQYYATQHDNDVKLYQKFQFEEFKKSDDFKFLTKNHIYSTVRDLKPIYASGI